MIITSKRLDCDDQNYDDRDDADMLMFSSVQLMVWDKSFKKYSTIYYKDAAKFDADFAAAFSKLLELGVPFPETAAIAA